MPIGWRPSSFSLSPPARRAPDRAGVAGGAVGATALMVASPQDCPASWSILVAASANVLVGSGLPKMTDELHASRKVCQICTELLTLGASVVGAACAANSL